MGFGGGGGSSGVTAHTHSNGAGDGGELEGEVTLINVRGTAIKAEAFL